jgi:hypothetical protein
MKTIQMQKVFDAIESERDYQTRKWGSIADHPHEVGGYILLMQEHLKRAAELWCGSTDDRKAMEEIRKVSALGVACGEQYGMQIRCNSQPIKGGRHK